MTDITRIPPPPNTPPELRAWWQTVATKYLSDLDARFAEWAGSAGLVVNDDGTVTMKAGAGIDGRSGSELPTILQRLANNGTASDSRLINLVNYANRNSVQSADDILTSSSGASSSTINVAAHTVKFDWGTVSYSSGSIAGLTPGTDYLVYATDTVPPSGGAVSYTATTAPADLIASNVYFVGTITTAIAASGSSITAATSANPIEFTTSANHGWANNDTVEFAALPGDFGTALNAVQKVIIVTALDKFTVAVNGSGFVAYTTGGTATRVSTSTQGGGGAGAGGGGSGGIWDGYTFIP